MQSNSASRWTWACRMGLVFVPIAALVILVGMPGCGRMTDPWEGETGTPRVVVTIAPLYSFVRGVAGKQASVKCLCTTTGPHHYTTDTRDARLIENANLFFSVGLELDEKFVDALVKLAKGKQLVSVKVGEKLPEKMLLPFHHEEEEHGHDHKKGDAHHDHDHGNLDPHVWMGIPEVIAMVEVIRDELSKVDEPHAGDYKKNADEYIKSLKKLEADGKASLANKKVKRIISFHDALGYFARTFDLEIADVIEEGPGDEPTSPHMLELIERCSSKTKPIGAITVEPQYPTTSSAAMVQRELKGKGIRIELVTVDPLETAEPKQLENEGATWYEARMRQNLKALADVLK